MDDNAVSCGIQKCYVQPGGVRRRVVSCRVVINVNGVL